MRWLLSQKEKRFWLGCAAAAALLAMALFFILGHDAGPYYQGKPLDTYWFRQLSLTQVAPNPMYMWAKREDVLVLHGNHYGHFGESQIAVNDAMLAMGTNSLPFLMGKLARRNSAFRKSVEKLLGKARINWVPWRDADAERAQAVTGILVLGQNRLATPGAIKRLEELSKGKDAEVAGSAKWVLQYCYPGP